MTFQNITRIWSLSNETSKNNLLFCSDSALGCLHYSPTELQLILTFQDEESAQNFLHSDVKLSIFVGNPQQNSVYYQDSITVMNLQKTENMYRIRFLVNNASNATKFTVAAPSSSEKPIFAMITFPSGKPTCIASSFLMVSGITSVSQSTQTGKSE